jgi:hypothetical protein
VRDYLTSEEYLALTNELKELVERKREPVTTRDFAFGYAYDGHMSGEPFLRIYAEYLMKYPKANVKDLHALCLGYGTAGSVIDELEKQDDDLELKKDDKKTYH